jgi:hypothetical protein
MQVKGVECATFDAYHLGMLDRVLLRRVSRPPFDSYIRFHPAN